jgi:hypothetical protein
MSSKRKFQRQRGTPESRESPDQTQHRIGTEQRTRELADLVKSRIPEGLGFVLITATFGGSDDPFHDMAYVSTMRREDSARLLTELVGRWLPSGIVTQPTHETATVMRESVHEIRQSAPAQILENIRKRLVELAACVEANDSHGVGSTALLLSCEALAIFDRCISRNDRKGPERNEPAAEQRDWSRGHASARWRPETEDNVADMAAEEVLRHATPRDPNVTVGDTKTTLVADLEAKPQTEQRDWIIAKAIAGEFHDYESDYAAPKMMLYKMLTEFGFHDIAQLVRDGRYDDEPATLEQEEELRSDIGPEFYDAVLGNKPRGKS